MFVEFKLTGQSPLLMHNLDIEQQDALKAWQKDPKNKNLSTPGDDRTPPWTWQTYCYSDGRYLSMPSQNVSVCLRQAGTQLILKRNKTFKELTQSGIVIRDEHFEFRNGGSRIGIDKIQAVKDSPFSEQSSLAQDLGFRLFAKRASVNQAKHVRVRPRFEAWTVTGSLEIVAKELTFEILKQIFDIAGRCGLCDWRPSCKTPGPYGMFTASLSSK